MNTKVHVKSLMLDPRTNMPVVTLTDPTDHRIVSIWVGLLEASAIATELEKITLDSPLPHDVLGRVLVSLDVCLSRIELREVVESNAKAQLILSKDGENIAVDARASDAIALALRMGSPIYVDDTVLNEPAWGNAAVKPVTRLANGGQEFSKGEQLTRLLETMPLERFGRYKM